MVEAVQKTGHTNLSPSGKGRWANCAGSVNLIAKIRAQMPPEAWAEIEKTSEAAAEGTRAHTIAARTLDNETEAWEYAGERMTVEGFEFVVNNEMIEGVTEYVDFIREKMDRLSERGARLYVEVALSSVQDKDAKGTADAIIFVPGERLIVVDLKYGRGITVEPDCDQLRMYGYMAVEQFGAQDVKVVELYIAQPRIPHPKGTIRRFVTDAATLCAEFIGETLPAMERTRDPNADLVIGEWCRFCPAKKAKKCPALNGEAIEVNTGIEPSHLSLIELEKLTMKIVELVKYKETLDAELFSRLMRGEQGEKFKLVRKMSNRIWHQAMTFEANDGVETTQAVEDAVKIEFGDEGFTKPSVLSPPNIEKLKGGKAFVSQWAYKPDSGLTFAAMSDKREAVQVSAEDHFGPDAALDIESL